MEELIQILVQFGGGKGGEPNNVVVRFLLPTFFWGVLTWISLREYRTTRVSKDLLVGIASLMGMTRELLMFVAEYGGWRGFVPFHFLYTYYPPLEHAITMLSCSFIGYAFMNLHLKWEKFSRQLMVTSVVVILLVYLLTATAWPGFLQQHPGISFANFWGDLAFRSFAVIFMGIVLGAFVHAAALGERISHALMCGFTFLFLDEFLMIFNILSQERHVEIFAPIRHNLHIWAIPFLVGMYWNDRNNRMIEAQQALQVLNADLEDRVALRTKQLTEINNELETFNYSVSHDLRAPVRHIEGYMNILVEDFADQLPDIVREYHTRIRRANHRMNEMIDALLNLSRTGRNELNVQKIDLSLLAREVATELAVSAPDRRVTFQIANRIKAPGDPGLIRLVMENLLGNAWKYSSGRESAVIAFGATIIEDETAFFVRDNGTGFDMSYADNLFAPFQRLHTESEFDGIGIGLATVKRVIRRHGGRVWAQAHVDEGATIYFTLLQHPEKTPQS